MNAHVIQLLCAYLTRCSCRTKKKQTDKMQREAAARKREAQYEAPVAPLVHAFATVFPLLSVAVLVNILLPHISLRAQPHVCMPCASVFFKLFAVVHDRTKQIMRK